MNVRVTGQGLGASEAVLAQALSEQREAIFRAGACKSRPAQQPQWALREAASFAACAMAQFNPNPFRGEASVPHVSETFFKVYFASSQARCALPLACSMAFLAGSGWDLGC